ncbi:haloacid dehalogenase-like hydrolase [Gordonia sp. TBRC 11910]|uniref:phosphoserine phosphatase n=1 Tax=Gordonia asplenii TaxID=2725283 RepID=A0A848L1G9_9ACTN|nr:haloacid dehalogenase-like hydrolase [Gordonia asplenii]
MAASGVAAGSTSGAGDAAAAPRVCPKLDAGLAWYGTNRERLQAIIDANSPCAGTWKGKRAPVALFDWDNTVVKNDIGYGTNYWMLRHDKVLQPPNADWKAAHRYMTTAAANALRKACGTSTPPGLPLPTSSNKACADEILAVLDDETSSGAKAFAGYVARRTLGDYEFSGALAAGHTAAELTGFAAAAKVHNLRAPIGAQDTVGSRRVDGYIRVYPQIKNLIAVLKGNGIVPWVVSASPEPIVTVWAPEVGIDAAHTVGVRYETLLGRLTARPQACGGASNAITYVDGKRCWANQAIFGITGPAAWRQAPADVRQILAAGDSTTDVTFVSDATKGHLVINRNKTELMCRAYDNRDGNWVINPMFIDPEKQQTTRYPCSTSGYTASNGAQLPLRRADGSIVPDQVDSVHG